MSRAVLPRLALLAAAILSACAAAPPPAAAPAVVQRQAPASGTAPAPSANSPAPGLPHYRCDHDIAFTIRYEDDSAVLDAGSHGRELLQRDAGGLNPAQTVYSNTEMRAELGLGPAGNEAVLHYASPALQAHCVRE